MLSATTAGRYMYAAGGNAEAARLAGVRVDAIRVLTFVLSGGAAGLAGVIDTSRVLSAQASSGDTALAFTVLAGIVVGGTSILGGEGAVWRTVVGVLFIALDRERLHPPRPRPALRADHDGRAPPRSGRARLLDERTTAMTTGTTASLDRTQALDLYRRMLLVRRFEDRVQSLFLRGEVYGTTHLYSGQEAVAVGFASALRDGDRIACTYRGHGHLLAMGTDPEGLLAELMGRAIGVNGGRAGSMNVVDPEHGVLGSYGIVGGSIAAATGAALSLKGSGSVAIAYFGDGATNQAYFFECLNLAKVLDLPVVFVCENNGYGEYTPFEAVTAGGIVPRAAALELPTTEVDGMDVRAVRAAAGEIVSRVRAGEGPEFVEARTYRFVGHSRSDPGKYRPEGELDEWRTRDPLLVAAAMLQEELGVPEAELDGVAREVDAEIDRIEAAAAAAPYPTSVDVPEFNEVRP